MHCGPHEGRHTGALVAERFDAMIYSFGIEVMSEVNMAMTTEDAGK